MRIFFFLFFSCNQSDFDEDDEESDLSESTSKKRRNILKEIGQLMIDKYVEIVSQYGDQEPFPKQFESARNAVCYIFPFYKWIF